MVERRVLSVSVSVQEVMSERQSERLRGDRGEAVGHQRNSEGGPRTLVPRSFCRENENPIIRYI